MGREVKLPILPAFTLWQPYAELPFCDAKPIETRTRPFPKGYAGKRVVIHAAAAYAPRRAVSDALHELCMEVWGCGYDTALFRGGSLGTIRLDSCCPVEEIRDDLDPDVLAAGDFSDGRWAWMWSDPIKFLRPIPCRGWQGWGRFQLPTEEAARLSQEDGADG